MIDLFHRIGVPTKTERGGGFPVSDRAQDVVEALRGYLIKLGVEIKYGHIGEELVIQQGKISGVRVKEGGFFRQIELLSPREAHLIPVPDLRETVIGWQHSGHKIIPLKPSLVPLETGNHG